MSKILIIGNVLKDVYLKLDERKNDFETDEVGTAWLDLGFNGSAHGFYRRTSVYGGAAVSLAVLSRLGIDAKIMGSRTEFKNGEIAWQDEPADYRYILCHGGEITYFVPSARRETDWTMPSGTPEWILVDRSTLVTAGLVEELSNFIKFSPSTKLAVHAEKRMTPAGQKLAKMADLLFLENEPEQRPDEKIVDKIETGRPDGQLVCYISPRKILLGDAEETWQLSRTDMLTHLTVYSTIVATVIGVISAGGSAADAVLWARLNAEQATLESSLSARKLKEQAGIEVDRRATARMIAKSLVAPRRGVLAADESDAVLTERLIGFGIPGTENTRARYRELLLGTPELPEYVSGVIITDEMAHRRTSTGQNYVDFLVSRGIIPGIKADCGQTRLGETAETYTLGTKGLVKRLRDYYAMGARFAKWHAKFIVDENAPSYRAVEQAALLLADFAKECQLIGLTPMIESEVAFAGDYSIERSMEATDRVLTAIFGKLARRKVDLSAVILKTNMIMAGKDAVAQSTPHEVGVATAAILKHAVPEEVGGVMLLSGGLEANLATKCLAEVAKNGPFPWPISFAFSRALQNPVMQTWKGKAENAKAAQGALKRHLQDNVNALKG